MNRKLRGFLPAAASACVFLISGCAYEQLRYTTLKLSSTLTDLNERQVLDNLARTAYDPAALPYFAMVTDGIADVKDQGQFNNNINTFIHAYNNVQLSPGVNRVVDGNWSIKPMVNPDRIIAMRGAYRLALGMGINETERDKLTFFLGPEGPDLVPFGFVCHGGFRDVPRKDAYIMQHKDGTYVWIMPNNAEAFSKFNLLILKLYLNKKDGTAQNIPAKKGEPEPTPDNPFLDPPNINNGRFLLR